MQTDPRTIIAAQNNADLYEAIFTAHNVAFERLPHAITAKGKPPPYYGHLNLLDPSGITFLNDLIKVQKQLFDGKIAIKDSFCQIDADAYGLVDLFQASWIWREAQGADAPSAWEEIKDTVDLEDWEDAWKTAGSPTDFQMFPELLLSKPNIHFFGRRTTNGNDAGCIANLSDDCVGISNVFALNGDVFADAAAVVSASFPTMPIVGYESGSDLVAATNAGFTQTGDLRILVVPKD